MCGEQGRNFGLKVRVSIQENIKVGRGYPSHPNTAFGVMGSVMSSLEGSGVEPRQKTVSV